MKKSQITQKTLLTSLLAMVLCLLMLVGSTFAWFTDSASASVNRIQAGELKVGLEMKNKDGAWVSAENQELPFLVNGQFPDPDATILWEPGCTYRLPALRVANLGNLALRYEIRVTGLEGSPKLLEVLKFFVNGADFSHEIGAYTGALPAAQNGVPSYSDELVLSAQMDSNAGSAYMGLSLEGISITVYATQAPVESDSIDSSYDESAFDALRELYPVSASAPVNRAGDTVLSGELFQIAVPADAVGDKTTDLRVDIAKDASVIPGFTVAAEGNRLEQFSVRVIGLAENNTAPIAVSLFIGKGYSFEGNSVSVKHRLADGSIEILSGVYDPAAGTVSFETTSFSPFAVEVPELPLVIGSGANTTFAETFTAALNAAMALPEEDRIVLFLSSASAPQIFEITEPTTLSGITFRAADGVTLAGLQLLGKKDALLTMDSLTFEGLSFTDKVLLGQADYSSNYSQCSNLTFRDCSFDLQNSAEKLKDAITHKGGSIRGDIASREKLAYLNGFLMENCSFRNVRYAFFSSHIRNVTIRGCEMEQCSGYALRLDNVAGQLTLEENRVTGAEGVLSINTVGNNYSTTDIVTDVVIRNNVAEEMTCRNGYIFYTTFDNARSSGKSTYTISGNSGSYTTDFEEEPLFGFRIKANYSPSKAEYIPNN